MDWPFRDAENTAVITTRQVLENRTPIVRVRRDAVDGDWQFHSAAPPSLDDARVIALSEVVERDPSLVELADLPRGWVAVRSGVGKRWHRHRDEDGDPDPDADVAEEKTASPMSVQTFTPPDVMAPIGPYSHIAKAGPFIMISATAGVDPRTGLVVGPDVDAQTRHIVKSLRRMLESVGSSMTRVMHVNVFLLNMADFDAMNRAYAEEFAEHRPARTVIGVHALPKPGALLTMNLMAVEETATELFA